MNYIQSNKEAWEEAFDNRDPGWGKNISECISTTEYAFFNSDMCAELKKINLKDKTIAHFCCNNGRELLSLMKWGKAKTGYGFDIAENQINFANHKSKELNVNAVFIPINIYDIDDSFAQMFEFALITIGCLCWFKDLNKFFSIISKTMKKDGIILINELHPITNMLAQPDDENFLKEYPLNLANSYFQKEWKNNNGMFYMAKKRYKSKEFTDFTHPFSEIINSITQNNFTIEFLNEYDYDISGSFEYIDHKEIPLSYILKAVKY